VTYNKRTLKTFLRAAAVAGALFAVCFLIVISNPRPPRAIYPTSMFDAIAIAPPGSAGIQLIKPVIGGRLNERFTVIWPPGLRLGTPESIVVRIAANKYEDLLNGIDVFNRKIKVEEWKGVPKLVVTLTGDSDLQILPEHTDAQVIVKGAKHKEWSWTVIPKASGQHRLILLVRGVQGSASEDYDPEVEQYDVAFNFLYLLTSGIQQNGISWLSAAVLMLLTGFVSYRFAINLEKRKARLGK
jgi:hypothetical protein